jgi:PAS domain S-box-containing protein
MAMLDDAGADLRQTVAALRRELDERTAERDEALAQQAATSEILSVISRSPADVEPVFDAIVASAARLCEAEFSAVARFDDGLLHLAALHSMSPEESAAFHSLYPRPPIRGFAMGRAFLDGRPVHFEDVLSQPDYDTRTREVLQTVARYRSFLGVPILREGKPIGVIGCGRRAVKPFTATQIELVKTFADQAAIAIENARLVDELETRNRDVSEALEQQTATAEVLQIINSSPGDLNPVFQGIVEKAHTLCSAACGSLQLWDGERFRGVAMRGFSEAMAEGLRRGYVPGPKHPCRRLLEGERIAHCAELAETDDPVTRAGAVALGGIRTILYVALRKDDVLLGQIVAARQEVRPFTEKEIALVENFAAQAVIAMENARLIDELRARTDELARREDELRESSERYALVTQAVAEGIYDWNISQNKLWVSARLIELFGWGNGDAAAGERPSQDWNDRVHPEDFAAYRAALRTALKGESPRLQCEYRIRLSNDEYRWVEDHAVPVREESGWAVRLVGAVSDITDRKHAEQELREALEQQTATTEVLKAISRSTFDLAAVLQTVVSAAHRLCQSDYSVIFRQEGDEYRWAAGYGISAEYEERERRAVIRQGTSTVIGRAVLAGRAIQIADAKSDPLYQGEAESDARTMLGVPLLRDGVAIGGIGLARNRVEPFTDKQVELVTTFADQAVIAIENTRLITETREALEQQTATAEVLQVINASPGDLTPVFEAILDKAHTFCGATLGSLFLFDGELSRAAVTHGYPDELAQRLRQGVILSATPQLLEGARWVHNPDLRLIDTPTARAVSGSGGVRTNLMLPLRKDGRLLGTISCNRQEVRPFSEKEIALLESFAAQAVIAMDNARLLNEIRQRQAELRVTFDNMGDGVAMFDAELRLAAWNLNFQKVLDLPDAFVAARPSYQQYARYLAERGEYGAVDVEEEVRRLSQLVGTEGSLERTRPDGRVIEVRYNAVPGGGFVLIYGDITERRRAEEKIRAARDTAETALRELQAAQANLIHAEKMASLGQLTAGIAHEIKNPLNFVNNFAWLSVELLDELKDAAAPAVASLGEETRAEIDEIVGMLTGNLERIAEHGRRADGIVKSMLAHSRGGSGEWQAVDINSLVDEALNLAYHGARAQDQNFNIALERDLDRKMAPIELVPQDVTRVFLNLFGNGFYAAAKRCGEASDPKFKPSLRVTTRDLGEAVEVKVRDNGTGITPEIRAKLFQPFFTTKPTGEGTGLGLSISWDIVTQQHGGYPHRRQQGRPIHRIHRPPAARGAGRNRRKNRMIGSKRLLRRSAPRNDAAYAVIASPRVRAPRGPRTGSAKQSRRPRPAARTAA